VEREECEVAKANGRSKVGNEKKRIRKSEVERKRSENLGGDLDVTCICTVQWRLVG
jgi:hypothetical protein